MTNITEECAYIHRNDVMEIVSELFKTPSDSHQVIEIEEFNMNRVMHYFNQEDADEFLDKYALPAFEEPALEWKEWNEAGDGVAHYVKEPPGLYYFSITNQINCLTCDTARKTGKDEPYMVLKLAIGNKCTTIQNCLNKFFDADIMAEGKFNPKSNN